MSRLRLTATSNCSPIHFRHIKSVWAHWYAVHWHAAAAFLQSYTHPTWLRFWVLVLGHLWSQNDVIASWLRLRARTSTDFPIHIRHIQSVWAHWYAVHWHTVAALHSNTHPMSLGSDFGVLGHLWSQNDVNMSWLRLTATSNCFPHPYYTYTKCLSTLMGPRGASLPIR
jgi:hypothetical protein